MSKLIDWLTVASILAAPMVYMAVWDYFNRLELGITILFSIALALLPWALYMEYR